MKELRGIPACTFCIQYDWEEKKCKLGCYKKEKETDYFFVGCPLPKIEKVCLDPANNFPDEEFWQ